jgi:hypothetical protein
MALVKVQTADHPRDRDRDAMIAYEALIYPVFLVIAMLRRVLPRSGSKARTGTRPSPAASSHGSSSTDDRDFPSSVYD